MDDYEYQRRMLRDMDLQKSLVQDITRNAAHYVERDLARHAHEMEALYKPPLTSTDLMSQHPRDSIATSRLFAPASADYLRDFKIAGINPTDIQLIGYWQDHRNNFVIPEPSWLQQLATDALAKNNFALSDIDAAARMGRMQTPWLDQRSPLVSATSFLAIQEIGFGANNTPFAPEFTDALRGHLGDWREVLLETAEQLTDAADRTEFYLERGFRSEIVDCPPDALDEMMEEAGLLDPDDEENLRRRDAASPYVGRIESGLRRYVKKVMTKEYGPGWETKLHRDTVLRLKETKEKRIKEGRPELPDLIYYAGLGDLLEVMNRRDHFKHFASKFERRESLQELFIRVLPARNAVAHIGIVTPLDILTLMTEYARLKRILDDEDKD
jgi:hypothetical protein